MKKFVSFLIITCTLLIFSNVESKGQCTSCPTNYTPMSFYYTFPSGCKVKINYCMFCQPTGNPISKLCSVDILYGEGNCSGLSIDQNFWLTIKKQMIMNLTENCSYSGEIEPCPTYSSFDVYTATCHFIVDYPSEQYASILPCDADPGECSQEFNVCFDDPNIIFTYEDPVLVTEGDCDLITVIFNPLALPGYCFSSCY